MDNQSEGEFEVDRGRKRSTGEDSTQSNKRRHEMIEDDDTTTCKLCDSPPFQSWNTLEGHLKSFHRIGSEQLKTFLLNNYDSYCESGTEDVSEPVTEEGAKNDSETKEGANNDLETVTKEGTEVDHENLTEEEAEDKKEDGTKDDRETEDVCSSPIEALPFVPKELLFSYISVKDLKNLRLSSPRLSQDVLRLDKRFRVWTRGHFTEDVPHYVTGLVFKLDSTDEDVFDCLHKNCHRITELRIDLLLDPDGRSGIAEYLSCPSLRFPNLEKVWIDTGSGTSQVVCKMLHKFGPKIEKLIIGEVDLSDADLSGVSLSSLKVMDFFNVTGLDSLLEILPSAAHSLETMKIVRASNGTLEIPYCEEEFSRLKEVEIELYSGDSSVPGLFAFLQNCCNSLTTLSLTNVDDFEMGHRRLGNLQKLTCWEPVSDLGTIIHENRHQLKSLELVAVFGGDEMFLNSTLPLLEDLKIGLYHSDDLPYLPNYLEQCSESLASLQLITVTFKGSLNLSVLNQFGGHLPALNKARIFNCEEGLEMLLMKCPNLTNLVLEKCTLDEAVSLPKLKQLILYKANGQALKMLLQSCRTSLETLHLLYTDDSILDEVAGDLPNLKKINIFPAPVEERLQDLMSDSKTEVITEDYPENLKYSLESFRDF